MVDYLLFTVLFSLFLLCVFITTNTSLHRFLPTFIVDGGKQIDILRLNFFFNTGYTLAAIPVLILFVIDTDLPDGDGWNRKTTGFVILLIWLLAVRLFEWFYKYAYKEHLFTNLTEVYAAIPGDEADKKPKAFDPKTWDFPLTRWRLLFFTGYILTLMGYIVSVRSMPESPYITYAVYPAIVGIVILANVVFAGVDMGDATSLNRIFNKFLNGVSKIRKIPISRVTGTSGKVFQIPSIKGDKQYNTATDGVLYSTMTNPAALKKGKDMTVVAHAGAEYAHIGESADMAKLLRSHVYKAKVEKYDLTTGGKLTLFTFGEQQMNEATFQRTQTILVFTLFYLSWSMIYFEDILVGTSFWFLSTFIPLCVGLNNPHAWWGVYTANQLAVLVFGWIHDQIHGLTYSDRMLFKDFNSTNFIPAGGLTNGTDAAMMNTVLVTSDVVAVYAVVVAILGVAGGYYWMPIAADVNER